MSINGALKELKIKNSFNRQFGNPISHFLSNIV